MPKKNGKAYISKLLNKNKIIDLFVVNKTSQIINDSVSEFGCKWKLTKSIVIDSNYSPGYYTIVYKTDTDSSFPHFIIENHSKSKIAVLAPISTWVAYNDWGGKSLYKNFLESKSVYFVSTKRPFHKLINKAESNISNFFIDNYNATLIPDYYLENHFELLKRFNVIVLAYHCEYFSEKMYENLNQLIKKHKISLISLGGNQIYWKAEWNSSYTVMECRKDLTSFSNSLFDYGGMWRHHFNKSEHNLLGVRFTRLGIHTYAPYKVIEPNHWVYSNLKVNNQTIFGIKGINSLPLSGDETDKIVSSNEKMTLLAKGLNCTNEYKKDSYNDQNCGENSGADFIIIEYGQYNILSTGSIESGAGLGIDSVFTGMIKNFIDRSISFKK